VVAGNQQDSITILLGLEGYAVGKVTEDEKGIVVEVRNRGREIACPRRGSKRLYRYGQCQG
jgi:hypothetical protein